MVVSQGFSIGYMQIAVSPRKKALFRERESRAENNRKAGINDARGLANVAKCRLFWFRKVGRISSPGENFFPGSTEQKRRSTPLGNTDQALTDQALTDRALTDQALTDKALTRM